MGGWAWRQAGRLAGLLVGGFLLMGLLDGLSLRLLGRTQTIDVGTWGDQDSLSGIFEQEQDAAGATYRWTSAHPALSLRGVGAGQPVLLGLEIGGLPPGLELPAAARLAAPGIAGLDLPLARTARRYLVLLPAAAGAHRQITIDAPALSAPPDPRVLGLRLDGLLLDWSPAGAALPSVALVLIQLGSAALFGLAGWLLGLGVRGVLALAGGLMAALAIMTGAFVIEAWVWQIRLLGALTLIALLSAALRPALRRSVAPLVGPGAYQGLAALWLITLLPPLLGILFPDFGSHDRGIHLGRLAAVMEGQRVLVDYLAEFHGRLAITPITYYVLVAPATLLVSDHGLALEGFYALIQATSGGVLAVAMLRAGASARAAGLGMALLAGMPLQLTILWWGFAPQIAGQWLLLLLALIILGNETRPPRWGWAAGALGLALLMHNGVALLGGLWISLYVASGWLREPERRREWVVWLAVLAGCSAAALALVYRDLFALMAQPAPSPPVPTAPFAERWPLIVAGFAATVRPLGLIAGLAGLLASAALPPSRRRRLLLAALAAGLIAFAIDCMMGLQVRYGYFLLPLIVGGLALLGDQAMRRWRWSAPAVWALALLVCAQGAWLWYNAAAYGVKPTLTGLTH